LSTKQYHIVAGVYELAGTAGRANDDELLSTKERAKDRSAIYLSREAKALEKLIGARRPKQG
jgi:hypothetical protein